MSKSIFVFILKLDFLSIFYTRCAEGDQDMYNTLSNDILCLMTLVPNLILSRDPFDYKNAWFVYVNLIWPVLETSKTHAQTEGLSCAYPYRWFSENFLVK